MSFYDLLRCFKGASFTRKDYVGVLCKAFNIFTKVGSKEHGNKTPQLINKMIRSKIKAKLTKCSHRCRFPSISFSPNHLSDYPNSDLYFFVCPVDEGNCYQTYVVNYAA